MYCLLMRCTYYITQVKSLCYCVVLLSFDLLDYFKVFNFNYIVVDTYLRLENQMYHSVTYCRNRKFRNVSFFFCYFRRLPG